MMRRTYEAEKTYTRFHGQKAINQFFKAHPESEEEWRETLEWMQQENVKHLDDTMMADGTYNAKWCYSLWFEEDDGYTCICIIQREEVTA